MIIVIDGPAGSGKSSTAKAVAKIMHIEYLDSGALYRALTWLYIQADKDEQMFFERLNQAKVSFSYVDGIFQVSINDTDITDKLRTEAVSDCVSTVASFPKSRSFVNALMQEMVQTGWYIAEGRDLGTAVFPHADLKFFMKANAEERARRRFNELQSADIDTTLDEVRANINSRDQKDANRKKDPLKQAADAIEIDTTDMDFEQQVQHICSIINEHTELTYKQ